MRSASVGRELRPLHRICLKEHPDAFHSAVGFLRWNACPLGMPEGAGADSADKCPAPHSVHTICHAHLRLESTIRHLATFSRASAREVRLGRLHTGSTCPLHASHALRISTAFSWMRCRARRGRGGLNSDAGLLALLIGGAAPQPGALHARLISPIDYEFFLQFTFVPAGRNHAPPLCSWHAGRALPGLRLANACRDL